MPPIYTHKTGVTFPANANLPLKTIKNTTILLCKANLIAIKRGYHMFDLEIPMRAEPRKAKYFIGQLVRHRIFPFRGVVFDVDPEFSNTEEWYESIPDDIKPNRDQPFYHLYAENDETEYVAYVSEQNLEVDENRAPVRHPQIDEIFVRNDDGDYMTKSIHRH